MAPRPDLAEFVARYEAGRPQVVWTSMVADLETPVSAMLKLAEGRPYSFLFEAVEGGAVRGRYSAIGLKPDRLWRCRANVAEINRAARHDRDAFEPCPEDALTELRKLIQETRIALPDGLPPMAAGLFGYMGYDMVRLMERLPAPNPDRLGIPDAVFVRPTVMAVFDNIEDRVVIVTPVWPQAALAARAAYDLARERLADVVADFDRGLPHRGDWRGAAALPEAQSNVTRERYHAMVEQAKEYIRAGDIFQVVPSQRFTLPFDLPPFALYRALRRLNPSPFLFFLDFDGFALVGSSPEILVRLRDDRVALRPPPGPRRRGAPRAEAAPLAAEMLPIRRSSPSI
jgi:anthranilate synthase component 1